MKIEKYVFAQHGDDRGTLVAIEECKDIPFDIKRVYYMYDTRSDVRRGCHAHTKLEQILICLRGSCKLLLDNGTEKEEIFLDKPYEGVYISNNMWRELYEFEDDTLIMVLASDFYKEEEYIRDYDAFLEYVRGEN